MKPIRESHKEFPVLHVGLDVGFHTTVFQVGKPVDENLPSPRSLPTCLAYGEPQDGARETLVGELAVERRHKYRVIHPLTWRNPRALFDFAQALRRAMDPSYRHELRGVVNLPQGATVEQLRGIRALANEIFDRTRLVDGATLMAVNSDAAEIHHPTTWVDIGANSVRVTRVAGGNTEGSETFVVPGGASAVRKRLRIELLRRFAHQPFSDLTVRRIQERFGHVRPASLDCQLHVAGEGHGSSEDIGSLITRACESLVEDVFTGLCQVPDALRDVRVAGAAAAMPGLGERLSRCLRDEFGRKVGLRVAEDPGTLVATGALRWAYRLDEEEWGVTPLSFAC